MAKQFLRRRCGRPSPALVVSLLALFVALGGTGVAAVQTLRPNSVGTIHLKNGAVTSLKVKDGSLSLRDLAPSARPAGTSGLSDLEIVYKDSAQDSDNFKAAVAECPAGKTLLGGGGGLSGSVSSLALTASQPSDPGTWIASGVEVNATSDTWGVRAYAICATVQ